jgi:hypothetical protein
MKALGQQTFIIKTDSKVIQEHIEKVSEARNLVLMKCLEKVTEMERRLKDYSVQHISRNDNNEADKLAKAATKNHAMPPYVFFQIIKEPFIKEPKPKIVNIVETRDWRAKIMAYLRGHYEPQDELEEKRLKATGKRLCRSGWRTLQVRGYRAMVEMYNLQKRYRTSQRNS